MTGCHNNFSLVSNFRASLATAEDESPGSDWLDNTLQATAQCLGRELCPPGC